MARTAHDVRHLRPCRFCRKLLDVRHSLRVAPKGHAHGQCYIDAYGLEALVHGFSQDVLGTLTVGDIGPVQMKRVLEVLEARKSE